MTSRDFCFWLQGYFELQGTGTAEPPKLHQFQIDCVRKHLALVFKHEIDPSAGSSAHQAELSHAHDPLAHVRPGESPGIRC